CCFKSAIKWVAKTSTSCSVSARNSSIKMASGSPSIKNLFLACSRLFLVQSKMVLSNNSQEYRLCFMATKVASKLFCTLVKWATTNTSFDGGNISSCKVMAVVNAKVPSLPHNNLATFMVLESPSGVEGSKSASTA